MENILLAIHLIIAVLLILSVLMQRSEGGGLGVTSGGNNSKPDLGGLDGMQKMTWWLGGAFMVMSIVLFIYSGGGSVSSSLIDQLDGVSATEATSEPEAAVPVDPNAIPLDPNAAN